ncbi:unnamed protein product [Arabidopsis halleri]
MNMQTKPSTPEAKPVYTAEKAGATKRQIRLKWDKSHRKNTSGKSELITFILCER